MITILKINARKPKGSKLTAVEFSIFPGRVIFDCSCGVRKLIKLSNFLSGNSMSCGCARTKTIHARRRPIKEINSEKPPDSRWTVLRYVPNKSLTPTMVRAKCSCGNIRKLRAYLVYTGGSKSCGCYNSEATRKRSTKWTKDERILKSRWDGMIARCYKPYSQRYNSYGARGVTVCQEWRESPEKFIKWALKNGFKKNLQLDKDIRGDGLLYSPDTCCFVTKDENARHKKYTPRIRYEWNGYMLGLKEICTMEDVPYSTVAARIRKGYSLKKSLTKCH